MSKAEVKNQSVLTKNFLTNKKNPYKTIKAKHVIKQHSSPMHLLVSESYYALQKKGHCTERFAHV